MNNIQNGQRVKVISGDYQGGIGEVQGLHQEPSINDHGEPVEVTIASVYLSGFVDGKEVQGVYPLPIDALEGC